jgi:hypothetical protein
VEKSIGFVVVWFVSLTEIASTDVLLKVFFHVFPSKVFASIGVAFFGAHVDKGLIVNMLHNLFSKGDFILYSIQNDFWHNQLEWVLVFVVVSVVE